MQDCTKIRQFLLAVKEREPSVLERIEHESADAWIEPDCFVFSIEALWRLFDPGNEISLQAFQRLLYTSELNRELAADDAKITIYRGTGKVRSNLYCLKTTSEGKSDC